MVYLLLLNKPKDRVFILNITETEEMGGFSNEGNGLEYSCKEYFDCELKTIYRDEVSRQMRYTTPVGEEFQVNTYTTSTQQKPFVVGLSDGGFIIGWESYGQDGSDYGIYGQKFDSSGDKVGGEFPINSNTSSVQQRMSMALLNNGNIIAVWESGHSGS